MTQNLKINALILAAGKGTRMKSARAKVLHEVFFKPMVHHVLDALQQTDINESVIIVGHQGQKVKESLASHTFSYVYQEEQLGTGHAVLCAESACSSCDTIMILCGDTPLVRPNTLQDMINQHKKNNAVLSLMTTCLSDPFGYGRIISDDDAKILEIVEQKDATEEQLHIGEVNAGIYLAQRDFLFDALKNVGTNNAQGEVYLTDIVAIANKRGHAVHKYIHPHAIDILGVNSRIELARAHQELQIRRNHELMLQGITIYSPETVFISPEVTIEQDTTIFPCVQISGNSNIGRNCVLETGVQITDCTIAANTTIGAHSCLRNCQIDQAETILPLTCRIELLP